MIGFPQIVHQVSDVFDVNKVSLLFAMFDRTANPAHGRMQGEDGQCGIVRLKNGKQLQAKGVQLIEPGQRLEILLPGGGGFGDSTQRDATLEEQDRRAGLISN